MRGVAATTAVLHEYLHTPACSMRGFLSNRTLINIRYIWNLF